MPVTYSGIYKGWLPQAESEAEPQESYDLMEITCFH